MNELTEKEIKKEIREMREEIMDKLRTIEGIIVGLSTGDLKF